MRIFRHMSLKHKLFSMIALSALMIFSMQMYYYLKFYGLTESRETEHVTTVMKQVEERIELFAQDVKDTALAASYNTIAGSYLRSDDPIYKLGLHKTVIEIISGIKSANKNIQSIMLVDREGHVVGASSASDYLILSEIQQKYQLGERSPQIPLFGKVQVPNEMRRDTYVYIHPVFDIPDDVPALGECIVVYRVSGLESLVMNIQSTANSLLAIVDDDNIVMAADRSGWEGTSLDGVPAGLLDGEGHEFRMEFRGRMSQALVNTVLTPGWKVVSLIPVDEMVSGLRPIQQEVFAIGIAITALIFVMSVLFMRGVTIPFARVLRFLDAVGDGNQGEKKRLHFSTRNEIGVLAAEINRMLDKIEIANEKYRQAATSLLQLDVAKKQAELSALQSQINPHFLYNTLECMRSIGLAYRASEVVEIAVSMAKIFRYSITNISFVYLRNEMECVQDYLHIMAIRYMDKFQVIIRVEEPILDVQIPKMILQPIVENAIYHGLERKKEQGELTIVGAETEDGHIRFDIIDNGAGMEEETLRRLQRQLSHDAEAKPDEPDEPGEPGEPHDMNDPGGLGDPNDPDGPGGSGGSGGSGRPGDPGESGGDPGRRAAGGIGLLNIHRRIRLAFGTPYGIEISSRKHRGTQVRINIPKQVP